MRTYIFVICMIAGMMGAYFALLPLAEMADTVSGVGPG
jgi:hypothetical protein